MCVLIVRYSRLINHFDIKARHSVDNNISTYPSKMNALTIAVAFSCFLAVYGLPVLEENTLTEIHGECKNTRVEDLVLIDQVHLPAKKDAFVEHNVS